MYLIWVPILARDPFLTPGWGPVPGSGASTSALPLGWSCGMGPGCQALPCPVAVQQQVSSSHRFSPSLCVLVLWLMLSVRERGNYYIGNEALTWICWPVLIFTWDNKMTIAFGQSPDVKEKNYRGRSETLDYQAMVEHRKTMACYSKLPHIHSVCWGGPERHLLQGTRAAPGLCCSEFHEDNTGVAQLGEEIN